MREGGALLRLRWGTGELECPGKLGWRDAFFVFGMVGGIGGKCGLRGLRECDNIEIPFREKGLTSRESSSPAGSGRFARESICWNLKIGKRRVMRLIGR